LKNSIHSRRKRLARRLLLAAVLALAFLTLELSYVAVPEFFTA
jgi:hypothetical protein